jgi:Uma2 family endonuclease
VSAIHNLRRHRLTVSDYHKMGETGILRESDRVELIEGEIFDMVPIGPQHAGMVGLLIQTLTPKVTGKAIINAQNPVILDEYSEPQPDILVLRPRQDFYRDTHPTAAGVILLIEICDTTVSTDRSLKMPLYAQHKIPEVWLIDLPNRCVELYRNPKPIERTYQQIEILREGKATSTELVEVSVDVEELFSY